MQNPLELTNYWLREIVIGLDLCPFAKVPFEKGQVRVVICEDSEEDEQVGYFLSELELLNESDSSELSTTLIVYPEASPNFSHFNDLVEDLQALLEEADLGDVFQLVAFHPGFMFEGTKARDVENLVNRSPYPTIHILRSEEFVSLLKMGEKSGESLSLMNEKKLKLISESERQRLFFYLKETV
jgi:uncharacterized protein